MSDPGQRLLFRYSRTSEGRFLSHRDTLRALERALRRSKLGVAFSQGFSPHPRMSFPLALATGHAGLDEPAVVEFVGETAPDEAREALNSSLPRGLRVESAGVVAGSASLQVVALEYELRADQEPGIAEGAVQALRERPSWLVVRAARPSARHAKPRRLDLKPWLNELEWAAPKVLRLCTQVERGMAIRPEEVLGALGAEARPGAWDITRRRVLLTVSGA